MKVTTLAQHTNVVAFEEIWTGREAGREKVGKKGVVRDPKVHEEVIEKVIAYGQSIGYATLHLEFSPIKGPEGNIEYLLHLKKKTDECLEDAVLDVKEIVAKAHEELDK